MEKEINNVFIKISSRMEIEPEELELGQDLKITLNGSIVKKEEKDNQDGTKDIIWVVKPYEAAVIYREP